MSGLIDPAEGAFEITPSDATNLAHVTRGLWVGTLGDIRLVTAAGDTVTLVAVAAGLVHPIRVRQVLVSGTTASDIVGIY
jgi:hypothetical protein